MSSPSTDSMFASDSDSDFSSHHYDGGDDTELSIPSDTPNLSAHFLHRCSTSPTTKSHLLLRRHDCSFQIQLCFVLTRFSGVIWMMRVNIIDIRLITEVERALRSITSTSK
ncbi:hypothetical protein Rs2_09519 [Raphanus sativus]|nr:hypothetical protein Rs2_09519 [Raphanus sativus]